MLKSLKPDFSIRNGAVRLKDLGYFLAGDVTADEKGIAHTAVFEWDPEAGWGGNDLNWIATACCVCDVPKEQLIVVGKNGEFFILGQGETIEGKIHTNTETAPLRTAQNIAGKAYAAGMRGQVFRRDEALVWNEITTGMNNNDDIEALDGFAENNIYAVGWKGRIWHYDGAKWTEQQSPVKTILNSVVCAGDDNVYACGLAGVLLKLNGSNWEVICENATKEDFWDIKWFDGKLYTSTTGNLYEITDNGLSPVSFGKDRPESCYKLSTRDSVLWSIGWWDAMAFDGKEWVRIS